MRPLPATRSPGYWAPTSTSADVAVWPGVYLDGRTAARRRATAEITARELLITLDTGVTLRWPWSEVRQAQGFYAGEQVRLERGGNTPEMLLVDEQAFVTAIRRANPAFGRAMHDPARRRWRLGLTAAAGLGAIAVAIVLYWWGIPAAARAATPLVPIAWEDRLGAAIVDELVPGDRRCHEPGGEAALQSVLTRVLAPARPQPYRFRAVVMDSPILNAFAAPGGHVVVLRGLLERAKSPEQLAGVLAHEVEHVLHRHATQALLQSMSAGLLVTALSGDVSGAMAYGVESARQLSALSYSRAAETEADTDGLGLLLAADIDPRGMIEFFDMLQKEETALPDLARYARTHPASAERAAALRRLAGEPRPTRPVLAKDAWAALRHICDR